MKKIIFILALFFISNSVDAQPSHLIDFQIGVMGTRYNSHIKTSKSTYSYLLPSFSISFARLSENYFFADIELSIRYRQLVFIKQKLYSISEGIEFAEIGLELHTGLQIERESTSHLPYLGIGIGHVIDYEYFSRQQGVTTYPYNKEPLLFNTLLPYFVLGNKLINSSFKEKRRNFSFRFYGRYYPLPLFQNNFTYSYGFNMSEVKQYSLFEIGISIGFCTVH
ncbi:MAG: hypothetical protein R2831_12465 [Chitinophagaceae bacterium]